MRISLSILFLVISSLSMAQNKRFYQRIEKAKQQSYNVALRPATTALLNVIDFDEAAYKGVILDAINEERERRSRPAFEQDTTYGRLCNVAINHFSKAYFLKSKYTSKVIRHFDFGLRRFQASHRLFKASVFTVNLVHLASYSQFYCNRRDQTTTLQLFLGKKSNLKPDDEEYKEPTPVKTLTEKELTAIILKKIKNNGGHKQLYSRLYTQMGVSIRLDKTSIHKHKIPRAYVIVLFGGKQTQKIRIKKPVIIDR